MPRFPDIRHKAEFASALCDDICYTCEFIGKAMDDEVVAKLKKAQELLNEVKTSEATHHVLLSQFNEAFSKLSEVRSTVNKMHRILNMVCNILDTCIDI